MDERNIRRKMEEAVDLVHGDISSIRTGRATPALVQEIVVTTYGGIQKLKVVELATIAIPDPRTILISPWDKSTIADIERAIVSANIGLTPVSDSQDIRINLPSLTTEDRENYKRLLHQKIENGRIMIRQIRQEAMEEARAAFDRKEFGEDERFQREKRIQELTDEYVGKIDEIGKQKEAELLSV